MDKDNILEIVNRKFTEYLTENKCRKTKERYTILNLIYSERRFFNLVSLNKAMIKQNLGVSRATLYNTMQLLLECRLVIRHQFGQNFPFYERAYNNDFHYHLICTNCNTIKEYKNPELQSIIQNKRIRNFNPSHYSLNIFGICYSCARRLKIKKNNNIER